MVNKVKQKRSATPNAVPTTGQLELGELAVNTYDGKLFFKKDNGAESIVTLPSGGGSIDVQTFTTSGTWTKPATNAEIDRVEVEILGAGQGGNAGSLNSSGTSGGLGGKYIKINFPPEGLNSTESVVIGAGGAGGIYGGASASNGGDTSLGSLKLGGSSGNVSYGDSTSFSNSLYTTHPEWYSRELSALGVTNNSFKSGAVGANSKGFDANGNLPVASYVYDSGVRHATATGQTSAANGTNDSEGLISYVGQATGTTSADLTGTHQVGDLILAFAFRDGNIRDGNTTPPTVPTGQGWNTIQSNGANICSSISAWKIADTTSETTGTWTNASTLMVLIYRNCHASSPIGQKSVLGGSGTAISFTGFDPNDSDHPWVVAFAGHRTGSSSFSSPAGFAVSFRGFAIDATDTCVAYDSNGIVTASTTTSLTFDGTTSDWQSQLIEIKRKEAITPTNGANGINLGAGGGAGGSANRGGLQAGNGGNGGPGGGGGAGGSARTHASIGTGLPGNGGNGGDGWVRVTTYLK